MSFPTYPEYKDSGVEWLGEVPAHWDVTRFKSIFRERTERSKDGCGELLSVSAYFGVRPRSLSIEEGEFLSRAESLEGYKVCDPGDLVINIMLAWNRGLGVAWTSGIVSPSYSVFSVIDGSNARFLEYLVRSDECTRYFKLHSHGVIDSRLRLYPEVFGRLSGVRPPRDQQIEIARFLDHETGKIDALIEEQRRLIELLKEKRQAVISHAVTKGLDPNVPMKDSGVEWLGEVPAHWSVVKVKHAAKLESGHTPSKANPEYWDGGIPWVSLNDSKALAKNDHISDTRFSISIEGINNSSARMLPPGAVVFTRDATIGLAAITTKEMTVSQHLIAWLCDPNRLLSEYLLLVFYGMKGELDRHTFGATLKTIGMPDIRRLFMPLPPLSEQKRIIDSVFERRTRLSEMVEEADKGIRLLRERRSALISAAVTGKIDVRGWSAGTEADEPELAMVAEESGGYSAQGGAQ
ncbi:restriction endonuclease subunit S [Thioalkalivibrio sp. ALE9]|uniref:restriction endonuclease subunit S n=1 Tax=Thioalkalivibrio sp. ALE9 TaxID=1158169 RepID=UPI0003AB154A|nr:restriction endonuclease subunit S [Thioalkalivibrio sp. ALE9]